MKSYRSWLPVLGILCLATLGTVSPTQALPRCTEICDCSSACNTPCDIPGANCGSWFGMCEGGSYCTFAFSSTKLTLAEVLGISNFPSTGNSGTSVTATQTPDFHPNP